MSIDAHNDMIRAYKDASSRSARRSLVPILRQQEDRIKEINNLAGTQAYINADTFTRRQMTQDLMRRFSDEGITGIRYSNGRTVGLDSYSELVARTQTKNAFNQGNWNRLQEHGIELTMISVHFPCSDLCEPYQGGVFSIKGDDGQYPPLEDAIAGGLFHVNCKHSSSGYIPGVSELPDADIGTRENREMYGAQQRQRQIERNIKKYKRRELSSVDPREREKARALVKKWQAEQRAHLGKNPYLRRAYGREAVSGTKGTTVKRPQPFSFKEAKSITEAENIAREVFGVDANYRHLDLSLANEMNRGVAATMNEFPGLKGFAVGKMKETSYARCHVGDIRRGVLSSPRDIRISTLGKEWNDVGIKRFTANLERDIKIKFHYNGMRPSSIMSHEMIHRIEADLLIKKLGLPTSGPLTREQFLSLQKAWSGDLYARDIRDTAIRNMGIKVPSREASEAYWYLGKYARKDSHEMIAQAASDAITNPGKNKFSMEVLKELKRRWAL